LVEKFGNAGKEQVAIIKPEEQENGASFSQRFAGVLCEEVFDILNGHLLQKEVCSG